MTQNRIPPASIGWPLLPVPNRAGELVYRSLEESVRDQIRVILQTRAGEQLMRPGFGGGLTEFLHEPNTLETRRRIRDRIQESLEAWEPRIVVDTVDVNDVADDPSAIRCEIYYRLRRNGAGQRLGLTVQVEG